MRPIKLLIVLAVLASPTSAWATTAQDEVDLANNLAKQGCYDSAVMFYNKALQYSPGYGPAISGRAQAMKALKSGKGISSIDKRKNKKPADVTAPIAQTVAPLPKPKPKLKPPPKAVVEATTHSHANQAVKVSVSPEASAQAKVQPQVTVKPQAIVKAPAKPSLEASAKPEIKPEMLPEPAATQHLQRSSPVTGIVAPKLTPEGGIHAPTPALATSEEDKTIGIHAPKETGIAVPRLAVPRMAENPIGIAAPPVSPQTASASDQSAPGDDAVPGWLIATACGTFVLLIVLAFFWLTPSLSNSRQLHKRLRGLERTRDER